MLVGLVSGCAHLSSQGDQWSVAEDVDITRDPFKGSSYFEGPMVRNKAENPDGSPEVEEIRLRAVKEKDRPERFFIDVVDYYEGDWRGFDQVFDLEGRKFHALSTRHAVSCTILCGYEEILEIEIPRSYLDIHSESGTTMRLYGPARSSSSPFFISGDYIRGFLSGVFEEASGSASPSDSFYRHDASHAAP
jgi:hypothetical protein